MKTSPLPSYSDRSRPGHALPTGLILAFVLLGAIICLASVFSLRPSAVSAVRYSAPELFNQANAYAREGKIALALVDYERARLLAPNDPNIRANLQLLQQQAGLPQMRENWLESSVSWAGPNTMAWLGCAGLTLLGAGILAARSLPQGRPLYRLAAVAGGILVVFSITSAVVTWEKCGQAVVITADAPAHISPTALAETSFKLRSGELISMNGSYHDFRLVRDAAGHSGWVRENDLAPLVP